ncbi:MAG: PilN domain-containing protein, partial [Nitrospinaceae bacterium]
FAKRMNEIDQGHPLKMMVLKELSQIIPKDTYITRISIKKSRMEIQGFSQAASQLIGKLENSPVFRNVAFAGSIVNQTKGQKFTIRSEVTKEKA